MTNWKKKRPWPHRPLNEGGWLVSEEGGGPVFGLSFFQAYVLGDLHQNKFRIHVQRPQESKIIKLLKNYGPCGFLVASRWGNPIWQEFAVGWHLIQDFLTSWSLHIFISGISKRSFHWKGNPRGMQAQSSPSQKMLMILWRATYWHSEMSWKWQLVLIKNAQAMP